MCMRCIEMRSCSLVLAVTVVAVLAGCGPASAGPASATSARPTGKPASSDAASLLSRPMRLPIAAAGSACPVTPIAPIKTAVTDPRGTGPLYFGGPMPQGGFPFNKVVYTTVGGAHGPILLRGGRIDGSGRLKFSGSPADLSEKAEIPPSPGGDPGSGSWAFYTTILDPGPDNALYVYPSTAGCYAIQVDAPSFSEVVVIKAS
jgi:hypothetical protein